MREELEVISRSGLRLGKLVNTLLDFSRIEAGRMQASYEPADIAQVTAELASVFRSAVDRAGLAFTVDCPPLPEPVYLDRSMWEKVVLNLLSNALKFTFDGSISVAARAEDGQAVVTVADTGIGVPQQEMPRLFERFHRIENTRSRSNEGSGIGLALVQELVQLHGGTITASSAAGEGTTFTIRLPFGHSHLPADALVPVGHAATASATADPFVREALRWLPGTAQNGAGSEPRPVHEEITPGSDADPSAQTGPALPARVLVADDNADMREYLTRLLGTAGYHVTTVTDGHAALAAVRADAPDLVISDVMMPRLDGLGLVAALREDARTAAVPVLLLSARAGQEASIEGLRAGADDYLVKPFSAAELLAAVPPLEVGGDWYDVIPLPGHRTGVVAGDCVGRGLPAAAIMGQLRSASQAVLLRASGPAEALTDLDTFASRIPGAECTSVFGAIIDPAAGTITYSCAGHPPPILVAAGGEYQLLDQARSLPLAMLPAGWRRSQAITALPPGATLMLYTDGLVERRNQPLDKGIDAAAVAMAEYPQDHPEDVADRVMSAMTPAVGYEDDVAILIYRHLPAPLTVQVPADDPSCLALLRARLRRWLSAAGLGSREATDIIIAAGEAAANAFEHAPVGRPADGAPVQITLTARAAPTVVQLTVADTGRWRPPPPDREQPAPGTRGHRVIFMHALMDDVTIDPSARGTTVTMTKELKP